MYLIFRFLSTESTFKNISKTGTTLCDKILDHCCYKSEIRLTRMGIKLSKATSIKN